ncbi:putative lipid II flippase FtsW [Breznakiella homolactica]|uniref:Probable peptidoglycan glycosyltransferase FtsW n=1 Tax=Breznakiella homolactica TaxID=2798577 RepID=A0A7T8B8J9_9SPIR|nr:putative lipid II flippase FtsW [Breznakiella homolactica]QQO07401.1 putative lipid II flippase FtsW [Breznakiella homolactica]
MIYQFGAERTGLKKSADHVLIASIILLTGLGLVTLYSASFGFAERFFGDGFYFIFRQVVFAGIGMVLFFAASFIRLETLRKWIKPLVIGTVILCILTFIPGIGVTKNGASRWIRLGSSTYQPSELVKLVLPLYLAHIFDKKRERLDEVSSGIMPPALITLLFFFLIYRQNNFSTAIFIAVNALILFFLAGVKMRYFAAALGILIPLSSLFILTKEHRLRRLISFIFPEWEPLGAGYQVRSSIVTIASGGLWGKGIGQGTRKIASVPEIHSDFIFSAYAEEAGLIGVLLFFLLLTFFAVRGYRTALRTGDVFRRLLACGLVTIIVSQALLNTGVVVGALPATGIPLPFFSAGGSSLATTLLTAGLIVNVSRMPRNEELHDVQ